MSMTFTKPNGKRRVVVTGAGMLTALGRTWDQAYDALRERKNLVRCMEGWEMYKTMNTRLACPYDGELPKFPRKKIRGMGRVGLLSLVATDDALRMAGFVDEEGNIDSVISSGRTGIAYGSCMGSMEALVDMCSMIDRGDTSKIDSQTYIKCMPQTCAANLSIFYQVRGRVIVTDTACTSASQAIGYAYEAIEDGRQDVMIAGGADELSAADLAIFDVMGAASTMNSTPELTPKAWDKDRDGLVIGEGSGTLILEDMEHAVNRGAKIYAEVAGFGTNMDGTHITNPNPETQAIALNMALLDAGISPDEIGYATTELVPLRPKEDEINKYFLAHLLRSDIFVAYANAIATGTKMPRMPMNSLRSFECILPPMDMQMKFVAIADQADKSKFNEVQIPIYRDV
mgnify:CR=1 FL=1